MDTGLIYDEKMCYHQTYGHPERPERIQSIFNQMEKENLVSKCKRITSRKATENEILLAHGKNYLEDMKLTPSLTDKQLITMESYLNSVYLNKHTYDCALLSAGSVIELCDQIVSGNLKNAVAIVRPPGHHAEPDSAMGFCIFNNVALAAKMAISKHKLDRIVILDWDAHHGNATQHMFEYNPKVLFISIHRYDNAKFYPSSRDAHPCFVGNGPGIGRNVNVAWNTNSIDKIGDTEYIYAYNNLLKPMLTEYDPQLIIVSAGFDCARNDPLGGLDVTPSGFNYLTSQLMNFANG